MTAEGAATFKCVGSNDLPGGQITVRGTERYKTARGQVKIEEVSGEEVRLTFRIIR